MCGYRLTVRLNDVVHDDVAPTAGVLINDLQSRFFADIRRDIPRFPIDDLLVPVVLSRESGCSANSFAIDK